jgi:hypothetical protein
MDPCTIPWSASVSDETWLSLPIKLAAQGRVAWRPYSPDTGCFGPSYFLRVEGREVFIGQRGMQGIHITFHKDGTSHLTAPNQAAAGAWGMAAKTPSEWTSLDQFHPGWTRLMRVVHPEPELRNFLEDGLDGVTNLVNLPVGRGMALHVCLLLYTGAPTNTEINFDHAVHVAEAVDGPDWLLEVMALHAPWPQHLRDWADEKRRIEPGSDGMSAVKPTFDRSSPSARLTKLVVMEDGARWLYDLAADPPE